MLEWIPRPKGNTSLRVSDRYSLILKIPTPAQISPHVILELVRQDWTKPGTSAIQSMRLRGPRDPSLLITSAEWTSRIEPASDISSNRCTLGDLNLKLAYKHDTRIGLRHIQLDRDY